MNSSFFFFNDTATTEIYTLSLHDALPIYPCAICADPRREASMLCVVEEPADVTAIERTDSMLRSEEHTSELQSRLHLVCRLLLEKKKKKHKRLLLWQYYEDRVKLIEALCT